MIPSSVALVALAFLVQALIPLAAAESAIRLHAIEPPALISLAADSAGEPLSRCLSRERVGVAIGEIFKPLGGGKAGAASHSMAVSTRIESDLRAFGAAVMTIQAPMSPVGSLNGVARPRDEAARRGATLLLSLGLSITERPLTSSFLSGSQFPLRTVEVDLQAFVVDPRTSEELAEMSLPTRFYAANSAEEAMRRLTSDDLADALAATLQQACMQRRTLPENIVRDDRASGSVAVAKGGDLSASSPPRAALAPGRHIAVVIGISHYQHLGLVATAETGGLADLKYAEADANAVAAFFSNQEKAGSWEVKSLVGPSATKVAVNSMLTDVLGTAVSSDVIVIFFSGHGRSNPQHDEDAYLLPYDFDPMDADSGIRIQQFRQRIADSHALQVIAFVDACRSGQNNLGGMKGAAAPLNQARLSLEGNAGHMQTLLASGTGTQPSIELDDLKHGLFTYYLLQALSEPSLKKPVPASNFYYLPLGELYQYVLERVKRRSQNAQIPSIYGDSGGRFDLWPVAFAK